MADRRLSSEPQSPLNLEPKTQSLYQRLFADGILLATAIMWGTNILVFKNAIGEFNPWIFNALRLVLATIALGILAWLEAVYFPRGAGAEGKRAPVPRVLAFCLLNGFLYLVIFVKGIDLTTAGNVALILASMPMWTAVLSYFFLRERLPRITWLGLLITFIGTVIVTTQSGGEVSFASEYFVGNLFMLLAALVWASGTVLSRTLLDKISPLRLAFLSSLTTTPLHILVALWVIQSSSGGPDAIDISDLIRRTREPATLAAIIYSGVFSTGIAYATWHAGVRAVGGSHAAVYQNVVTLVAVVGGWVVLREQPMLAQLVGGALTIAGLVLMRRGRRGPAK